MQITIPLPPATVICFKRAFPFVMRPVVLRIKQVSVPGMGVFTISRAYGTFLKRWFELNSNNTALNFKTWKQGEEKKESLRIK